MHLAAQDVVFAAISPCFSFCWISFDFPCMLSLRGMIGGISSWL
ncbi:MAG: hypothetical protein ACI85V_003511 [bacterium]|jgi:hypothetical protein